MTRLHPIQIPGGLVRDQEMDLANAFVWEHHAVSTGPSGDRYVLSDVFYNHSLYDDARSDWKNVLGQVLTRYTPDGEPIAQAFVDCEYRSPAGGSLSALPDGRVLCSTQNNRTFAFTPGLESMEEVTAPGADQWAFRTRLTPSGRALCLLGENVVALSPEPVGERLPALTAVTALMRERPHLRRAPRYCPPTGASGEGTPRTELVEQLDAESGGRFGLRAETLRDAVPVDDSTFVVLAVGWHKHAGQRGGDFLFALVNTDGTVVGHLDLHTYWDSAARGMRYDVVVDQQRRRIFHLNTFGLYVFDDSGARTLHLSTEDKVYKPLAHLRLHEFDPAGHLVLVHEKQNLVLTVTVPEDLADLPGAVVDALAHFRKERTRLKKEHRPENWHWTAADTPLTFF